MLFLGAYRRLGMQPRYFYPVFRGKGILNALKGFASERKLSTAVQEVWQATGHKG